MALSPIDLANSLISAHFYGTDFKDIFPKVQAALKSFKYDAVRNTTRGKGLSQCRPSDTRSQNIFCGRCTAHSNDLFRDKYNGEMQSAVIAKFNLCTVTEEEAAELDKDPATTKMRLTITHLYPHPAECGGVTPNETDWRGYRKLKLDFNNVIGTGGGVLKPILEKIECLKKNRSDQIISGVSNQYLFSPICWYTLFLITHSIL